MVDGAYISRVKIIASRKQSKEKCGECRHKLTAGKLLGSYDSRWCFSKITWVVRLCSLEAKNCHFKSLSPFYTLHIHKYFVMWDLWPKSSRTKFNLRLIRAETMRLPSDSWKNYYHHRRQDFMSAMCDVNIQTIRRRILSKAVKKWWIFEIPKTVEKKVN